MSDCCSWSIWSWNCIYIKLDVQKNLIRLLIFLNFYTYLIIKFIIFFYFSLITLNLTSLFSENLQTMLENFKPFYSFYLPLCWLLRIASAVQLYLHPASIVQVELHPSPEPIWSGFGMPSFQKEMAMFPFSRPRRIGIVLFRTGGALIWTGSIPVWQNCLMR